MSRGRRRHSDPPVNYYISMPQTLAAKIELALFDPTTGKPKYGGRSQLFQILARRWLEEGSPDLTPFMALDTVEENG